MLRTRGNWWPKAVVALTLMCVATQARAISVLMKDGRTVEGKPGTASGLMENAIAEAKKNGDEASIVRTIMLFDDDLRRTFVPKMRIAAIQEADAGEKPEVINIKQRVAQAGARIGHVGPIIGVTPFDKWGRRRFSMLSERGELHIFQGITQITPLWTKVEGVIPGAGNTPFVWDMRIATSSIPRDLLSEIISNPANRGGKIDANNAEMRLQVVRLFIQSERYQDALKELEAVISDFPDEERYRRELPALRQLHARRIIDEINVRRKAGQHQLAFNLLSSFPTEDVAGETLQQVREILAEYSAATKQRDELFKQLKQDLSIMKEPGSEKDSQPLFEEMIQELNLNNVDRMADYIRLGSDPQLTGEEKFSLALSGWLMGSNEAVTNYKVSMSLAHVRNLVRDYLREPVKMRRDKILKELKAQEGAAPRLVAKLVAHMTPPVVTEPSNEDGYYELEVPGIDKEPNVNYFVQLPPEYDPYRRYPTIIALNGSGTTPQHELDWWAGDRDPKGPTDPKEPKKQRQGQATRLGYITIAVDWAREEQREYEYSAREHAAVLSSLRDACRRFAIDTDRVFLAGHSMGGDAVWDIGLAHPDLWAGVIPIVAVADKYCNQYTENAANVPFYVVLGEMDGDKINRNAMSLDRYLKRGYDTTVVEYLGRGHEHFHDEIQRIFDWMSRRQRNFFPKKFKAMSMRTWDNYFWWVEMDPKSFPPRTVVEPSDWTGKGNARPLSIEGNIVGNNVHANVGKATIWLCPELVDFDKPIKISLKGKAISPNDKRLEPNLEVLLEDVRTRGERLHPFYIKLDAM